MSMSQDIPGFANLHASSSLILAGKEMIEEPCAWVPTGETQIILPVAFSSGNASKVTLTCWPISS